jgi:uncharacterized phage-associated protein
MARITYKLSAHDVAAYILEKRGAMTAIKLQKLVYYCQAWHLAWEEVPLFSERIEAWANGPVVPTLYRVHRRLFEVNKWPEGNSARLRDNERESIDAVLKTYADFAPWQLTELTHRELPWTEARKGLATGERGTNTISPETMRDYYAGLIASTA